jgi:heme-degrading monooxygenase HmoA
LPALRAIEGHCGAYLLRRTVGDTVEFVVLTLWESMCAVQEFVGQELNRAVVKPEARAILSSFDDFVTHFEIIAGPNS